MRICRFDDGARARMGTVVDERIVDLRAAVEAHLARSGAGDPASRAWEIVPDDVPAFLARDGQHNATLRAALADPAAECTRPLSSSRLLAPIGKPGKIIGVGRNYGAHAAEGGLQTQEEPRLFIKVSSSVIGPGAPIPRPSGVRKLDFEIELAVIVGREMREIAEADALDFVAGYTILNDVSAREFQFDVSPPQTSFAKSMDGFTPLGPWIVTAEEFGEPTPLSLRTFVNGVPMQEGSTADMIFPIERILAYVARHLTLEPGDIVATGTPAGVGHFRTPPTYLVPGDLIRMEISRIGVLENGVVAG